VTFWDLEEEGGGTEFDLVFGFEGTSGEEEGGREGGTSLVVQGGMEGRKRERERRGVYRKEERTTFPAERTRILS